MIGKRIILAGGTVVTPTQARENCDLLMEDGKIIALGSLKDCVSSEIIDVRGQYVLPGLIDLHTDALEHEITPRPGANFPLDVALQEIDAKMLCCGITTVFHSLHLGYDDAVLKDRSKYTREQIFEAAFHFAKTEALANAKIHLRFEITGIQVVEVFETLVRSGIIDLVSFMDHTPGQGQYPRKQFIENSIKAGKTEAEATAELERKGARPKVSKEEIQRLANLALSLGIAVASHDDDSPAKVSENRKMGIGISEFPITLDTARHAKSLGITVLGGASNILRGGSLSGNLRMQDAIDEGIIDGLCSDYYPPSILHAVFKLWANGTLPLHDAINLATKNPARAAGIGHYLGSIEPSMDADVIVVSWNGYRPRITRTFRRGTLVYSTPRPASPKATTRSNQPIAEFASTAKSS